MRSWFMDSNGNWRPVYGIDGMYHPDWLEQFFDAQELAQFRHEINLFSDNDKPTWKEYLNFKYSA